MRLRAVALSTTAVLCIYVSAYYILVERGWPGSKIIDSPTDRISVPASFDFDEVEPEVMSSIFTPIHQVDRVIRWNFWNPRAFDYAEHARVEGMISSSNAE